MNLMRLVSRYRYLLLLALTLLMIATGLFLPSAVLRAERRRLFAGYASWNIGTEVDLNAAPFAVLTLPEEEMAQLLRTMADAPEAYYYTPRAGEMTETQAVALAIEELQNLYERQIAPKEVTDLSDSQYTALLAAAVSADAKEGEVDPLYGVWIISFVRNDLYVTVDISASTGKILELQIEKRPQLDRAEATQMLEGQRILVDGKYEIVSAQAAGDNTMTEGFSGGNDAADDWSNPYAPGILGSYIAYLGFDEERAAKAMNIEGEGNYCDLYLQEYKLHVWMSYGSWVEVTENGAYDAGYSYMLQID